MMDFIYSDCSKCGVRVGAHTKEESIACGTIKAAPPTAPPTAPRAATAPPTEEWRKAVSTSHPELATDLEVSNMGKVRNTKTGRLYKGTKDSGKMTITRETIGLRVIHLVAETFIATREEMPGLFIKNKDGDYTNNAVSNIEYVTHIGHNGLSLAQRKNLMAKIEKTKGEIKERQELLTQMEERLEKFTPTE